MTHLDGIVDITYVLFIVSMLITILLLLPWWVFFRPKIGGPTLLCAIIIGSVIYLLFNTPLIAFTTYSICTDENFYKQNHLFISDFLCYLWRGYFIVLFVCLYVGVLWPFFKTNPCCKCPMNASKGLPDTDLPHETEV